MKIGAVKKEAGKTARLVELTLASAHQQVTPETFRFSINRDKLRLSPGHAKLVFTQESRKMQAFLRLQGANRQGYRLMAWN